MCEMHRKRLRLTGDAGSPAPLRAANGEGQWYSSILVDGVQVLEHRFVMEQQLGRPLLSTETVHHRNGLKYDNTPGNLELWTTVHPGGVRVADLLEYVAKHHRHEILRILNNQKDQA
jgi:hypothetical protein